MSKKSYKQHGPHRVTLCGVCKYIGLPYVEGTEFQKKVWKTLCAIPRGKVVTYGELARQIGRPDAVRAVANAVGANPLAPLIPCHRVIRSDGSPGGYSGKGGTRTKRLLLRKEGVLI